MKELIMKCFDRIIELMIGKFFIIVFGVMI